MANWSQFMNWLQRLWKRLTGPGQAEIPPAGEQRHGEMQETDRQVMERELAQMRAQLRAQLRAEQARLEEEARKWKLETR
ncbi:MAG TPA: hypothetical protein VFB60_14465 [Ktedonobacteraceae bacterium]|nr:hypothetical protein [Ktedonobacteraceae bacterium]